MALDQQVQGGPLPNGVVPGSPDGAECGERLMQKCREEEITLAVMPNATQLAHWRLSSYGITAVSGRPDDSAWRWIKEVEAPDGIIEQFRESGSEFVAVDIKLASAPLRICHGSRGHEFHVYG